MIVLTIVVLRSKQSFKYDHLRKEASDLQPWTTDCAGVEGLRSTIEAEVASYVKSHYNHGVSAVFSKEVTFQLMIIVHPTLGFGRQAKALLSALKITNTVQETSGTGDGAVSGLSISTGARLKCWGCSKFRSVVKRRHFFQNPSVIKRNAR